MSKTTTLNLRVNPTIKRQAEEVLEELGIPMSTAINMYLKQIHMTGGIPFSVELPKVPRDINADLMSDSELKDKLNKGYEDFKAGRIMDAEEAFNKFRESKIL